LTGAKRGYIKAGVRFLNIDGQRVLRQQCYSLAASVSSQHRNYITLPLIGEYSLMAHKQITLVLRCDRLAS
jgi:hypothetical protein